MDLSLSKLPWWGQVGAFVVVCLGATYGFYHFYVSEMEGDIQVRRTRLAALRADITRGVATARSLPRFQSDVNRLEQQLETLRAVLPEEKDVADILRRIQGLATQSNLTIQRFQPGKVVQQPMYAEIPYKLQAEGTYHNLGYFFDRVSKFPRIINVGAISIKAKTPPAQEATIVAECVATTFVLQEPGQGTAKSGKGVSKPQAAAK
jgi:type IV pilus assembly protein PilO